MLLCCLTRLALTCFPSFHSWLRLRLPFPATSPWLSFSLLSSASGLGYTLFAILLLFCFVARGLSTGYRKIPACCMLHAYCQTRNGLSQRRQQENNNKRWVRDCSVCLSLELAPYFISLLWFDALTSCWPAIRYVFDEQRCFADIGFSPISVAHKRSS